MTAKKDRFIALDVDGTLIRWQLYHAVVDRMAKKNLLGKDAHERLHKARMVWKRREHANAFYDYEAEVIAVYESALPSLSYEQFNEVVKEIAEEYKAQIYTYPRDLARKLKKQGYKLIAISGSHEELIRHLADTHDFDIYIGTRYEQIDGVFTGEKIVGSHNKAESLAKLVEANNLTWDDSYAVGDSKSDADMLAVVANPIAFNPNQELFHIAKEKGWDIVIERKNMVYELNQKDGEYVLV